jgi:single-stranded-DNA-specific exonuclease
MGLGDAAAEVVARRCVGSDGPAAFLAARLSGLPSPGTLPDIDAGAERLADAVVGGERVTVFGDYDVDGCTSSAVLLRFLADCGLAAKVRLPHRLKDGYGIKPSMVEALAPEADLLITVDCGATAFDALERARDLGLDVIVCDHHTVANKVPVAVAVINPKRPESTYPGGEPAAVGVAWNLVAWTRKNLRERGFFDGREEPDIAALLDLVALGTVCDMVPLNGANRTFVRHGLRRLSQRATTGLRVFQVGAKCNQPTDASDLGFRLGPRINAAGRLADAQIALDLLLCDDEAEAQRLFEVLDGLNVERRETQRQATREAEEMVRAAAHLPDAIVAYNPDWHPGVVGLVASRLAERFNRCAVVIGSGGKGSARAAGDLSIYDAVAAGRDCLSSFGGHRAAAGLTLTDLGQLGRLRERVNRSVREQIGALGHRRTRLFDVELAPHRAIVDLALELRQIAPFGMGNPAPVFFAQQVEILQRTVKNKGFTILSVDSPGALDGGSNWARKCELSGFDLSPSADAGAVVDVLYTVEVNTFRGRESVRRRIQALREVKG